MIYNPWPIGQVPEHLQRPELKQLKEAGYKFDDPREVVDIFEKKVAKFFGAPYAVAVDCCTHGIELCLKLCHQDWEVTIPKNIYISIPMAIKRRGFNVYFEKKKWRGFYQLWPLAIYDAATFWTEGGYIKKTVMVISFQIKKYIPIGKGGMILTDSKEYYEELKLLRYDGRDLDTPYDSENHIKTTGFHYYMTPEDAARGILLMDAKPGNYKGGSWKDYPNVKKMLKNIDKPKEEKTKFIYERDGIKIFRRPSGCYEERELI